MKKSSIKMKPRDLMENVKEEPVSNKVRIAILSTVMFGVSSAYGMYFQDVARRSVQFQEEALAGLRDFNTFVDSKELLFKAQIELDILQDKDIKDLKYIAEHWHSQRINGKNWGPQGDTTDGGFWYVQTARLEKEQSEATEDYQYDPEDARLTVSGDNKAPTDKTVAADTAKYEEWADWYKDMLWFDTAGCVDLTYQQHIGGVIDTAFSPRGNSWKKEDPNTDINEVDDDAYWGTYLQRRTGSIGHKDTSAQENWLQNSIDILSDCDKDCQKFGSGMTLVSILNWVALMIIWVNSILMFAGTWRPMARITSVYCTPFACIFQLVILIISGAILFRPYAMQCGHSLQETYGEDVFWTMSDDYQTMVGLWASQWFWMFAFLCFGSYYGARTVAKKY